MFKETIMKNQKKFSKSHFYDDEDESLHVSKKQLSESHRRRPIRNWTKAWVEHEEEAEEIDDFYQIKN